MESNLTLGRIAGIRVGVHWSVLVIWWLLASSLSTSLLPDAVDGQSRATYWVTGGATAVMLLGCLLAHELSHAIVARRHGVGTSAITLWALGGVATLEQDAPTPKGELLIAAAGPTASLGIAGGAFVASATLDLVGAPDLVLAAIAWLSIVNLILAAFNLLPGIPLDGGRILHAALWRRSGDRVEATRSAARAGRLLGFGMIGLGVFEITAGAWTGLWLVLIGWFLLSAATVERDFGGLHHALRDISAAEVMTSHPDTVPGPLTVDRLLEEFMLRLRHTSFPVHDDHGQVIGLVTLAEVKQVEPGARVSTTVATIATPLARTPTVTPSTPLTELMSTLARDPNGRARRVLVVDERAPGRSEVVGIITPTDIARAIELGEVVHA